MKKLTNGTATVVALVVLLAIIAEETQARVVLASKGPRYHRAPSTHELVFEGGLTEPLGDQKDDYWSTDTGFGASTGYQLGGRYRYYVSESFAVSPAFHYTRYGTDSGVVDYGNQGNLAYNIRTSGYRYGMDFQAFVGPGGSPARLFLTGGVGLANNRYRDELQFNGVFEASVNSPVYSAGLGLKLKNLELTAEYTINRFDTTKFSFDGFKQSYNWDHLVVRAGISFGR